MAFNLFVLFNNSQTFNELEDLQAIITDYFSCDKNVKVSIFEESFVGKNIKVSWDNWAAKFFIEEDNQTIQDNKYILSKDEKLLHVLGESISNRRIRVYFNSDDERKYTNQCMDIIDFIKSIPNSVVYNPQEENIWD
jgi:hypothetical protein